LKELLAITKLDRFIETVASEAEELGMSRLRAPLRVDD